MSYLTHTPIIIPLDGHLSAFSSYIRSMLVVILFFLCIKVRIFFSLSRVAHDVIFLKLFRVFSNTVILFTIKVILVYLRIHIKIIKPTIRMNNST